MKTKTIEKVIREKIEDWLESIEDKEVRDLAAKNTIVTGGCIASMLLKEKVNDYDIYFRNRTTAIEVAKYYVNRFKIKNKEGIDFSIFVDTSKDDRVRIMVKSAGVASEGGSEKPYQYFEGSAEGEAGEYVSKVMTDPGDIEDTREDAQTAFNDQSDGSKPRYRPVFLSTNAVTLSGRIQIVLRFYGSPEEIHSNYDYVHCTNYWISWEDKGLRLNQKALEVLLTRELLYVGSKYPICSLFRLRKFIKRGWSVNAGQILKISLQISDLNLNDLEVLQDQLTGVDVAYFIEVLGKLREKDPEKVNRAYLIEIVDRMF